MIVLSDHHYTSTHADSLVRQTHGTTLSLSVYGPRLGSLDWWIHQPKHKLEVDVLHHCHLVRHRVGLFMGIRARILQATSLEDKSQEVSFLQPTFTTHVSTMLTWGRAWTDFERNKTIRTCMLPLSETINRLPVP